MVVLPVALIAAFLGFLGLRLVQSGLRARGAELWLGLFFAGAAGAMFLRFCLALGFDLVDDPAAANLLAQAVMHASVCCFAAFVWQTFRRDQGWGRGLFLAIVAVYVTNTALFWWTGAYASQPHPFHAVLSGCLSLVFAWSFAESLAYFRAMRRRVRVGLADAVVANRFLLFSVWTAGMTLMPIAITAIRIVRLATLDGPAAGDASVVVPDEAAWTLRAIRLCVVAIGIPTIAGIWLAFFPPAAYTRRVAASTA